MVATAHSLGDTLADNADNADTPLLKEQVCRLHTALHGHTWDSQGVLASQVGAAPGISKQTAHVSPVAASRMLALALASSELSMRRTASASPVLTKATRTAGQRDGSPVVVSRLVGLPASRWPPGESSQLHR